MIKIIDYLNQEFGENVTKSFVIKTYDLLDILSEFPELGSVEHRKKKIRGFTIVKNINIFYRIENETIYLLDFFDNRQNPKKKIF